jgi:GR25 family glycosyltransferase involved in LPS biosynthesis
MNIPIFCINLERATERKQKIEDLWIKNLGFDITFWKAWDRRDVDNGKFYFPYDSKLTQKTIKRQLSSGEIACSTSHCMVYEHAIKNNLDYCIVMEDDILPSRHTNVNMVNELLLKHKEIPECNIILLHEIYEKINQTPFLKETENFKILSKWPFGNQITLFTKKGLELMFNNLSGLNHVADHWNIFPFSNPSKDICIIKKSIGRHEYHCSKDSNTYIGIRSGIRKCYKE